VAYRILSDAELWAWVNVDPEGAGSILPQREYVTSTTVEVGVNGMTAVGPSH